MTHAETINPARIVQFEIHVADIERSKSFYENVFGWPVVPAEIYHYHVLEVPDDCPWGISLIPHRENSAPTKSSIVIYFEVENPESIASLANNFGGKKIFGPTKLPAYGDIWQVIDPDGNRFGLFRKTEKTYETV